MRFAVEPMPDVLRDMGGGSVDWRWGSCSCRIRLLRCARVRLSPSGVCDRGGSLASRASKGRLRDDAVSDGVTRLRLGVEPTSVLNEVLVVLLSSIWLRWSKRLFVLDVLRGAEKFRVASAALCSSTGDSMSGWVKRGADGMRFFVELLWTAEEGRAAGGSAVGSPLWNE